MHHLEIVSSTSPALKELFRSGRATPETYDALMVKAYRLYPREHVAVFRAVFGLLLDEASYPLLFNCSAGKDRTGMAAALILTALGVHEDIVMQDYLLTNKHWRGTSSFARSAPPDLVPTIIKADAQYLHAAFATIVDDHGSIDAFIERQLVSAPPNAKSFGGCCSTRRPC